MLVPIAGFKEPAVWSWCREETGLPKQVCMLCDRSRVLIATACTLVHVKCTMCDIVLPVHVHM